MLLAESKATASFKQSAPTFIQGAGVFANNLAALPVYPAAPALSASSAPLR